MKDKIMTPWLNAIRSKGDKLPLPPSVSLSSFDPFLRVFRSFLFFASVLFLCNLLLTLPLSSVLFLTHNFPSNLYSSLSSSSVLSLPRRVTQRQSPPGGQYGDVRLSLLRQEGELSLKHTHPCTHSCTHVSPSVLSFLPHSFFLSTPVFTLIPSLLSPNRSFLLCIRFSP